ncbi:MAG: family 78 glycoside hydrolase catalytic domain, partial [Aristaeellaceae bacterium]
RLTPYSNNYTEWVQYQTYDVTALLAKSNSLDVTLGNGWYKGRFGFTSQPEGRGYYGDEWKLIAELRVRFADGTEQVLGTDDTWTVTRSRITFSNIYDGEHRDDTLPGLPEERAALLDASIPLCDRMSIPVRVQEEREPVELLHTPAGEWVWDIGQNMTGIFRLRVHEPRGTRIHVQVGEVLQQGCFYRDNLRSARAEYIYISDGEAHVLEPRFTFYGFRYVKVEGVAAPKKDDLTALVLYSDVTPAGRLETGAPKINQLISNIMWGQKGNFVDVPTDCPQRDERMGWTADTQVFVPTACYFTDSAAFYRKYLYDLRTEQRMHGGMVPDVIPSAGNAGQGCSVWGDAATIIPWDLYLFYGDRSILAESFDSMKAWVDYIRREDGEDHGWARHYHYGDWLALDHPSGGVDQVKGGTEDAFVAYVYYLYSARLVARAAEILGKAENERHYTELADRIHRYILDEYYTPNGRCAITTQTGYVLTLYYHLNEDRPRALKSLIELIRAKGNKFVTGFVGTPLIQRVLSGEGENDLAYHILFNEEYPGWLYEVNMGATTIWERWNSMEPDGSVSSTGMNSFNHYALGSVGEWMWRYVAGINPDEQRPGFRHVLLQPVPYARLGNVRADYASPAGTYHVAWQVVDASHVSLEVTVPFNCEATLRLPWARDQEKTSLTAGTYRFELETRASLYRVHSTGELLGDLLDNPATRAVLTANVQLIDQAPSAMRTAPLRAALSRKPNAEALIGKLDRLLAEVVD